MNSNVESMARSVVNEVEKYTQVPMSRFQREDAENTIVEVIRKAFETNAKFRQIAREQRREGVKKYMRRVYALWAKRHANDVYDALPTSFWKKGIPLA